MDLLDYEVEQFGILNRGRRATVNPEYLPTRREALHKTFVSRSVGCSLRCRPALCEGDRGMSLEPLLTLAQTKGVSMQRQFTSMNAGSLARPVLVFVASLFGFAALPQAVSAEPNAMHIVVSNGPVAGTYPIPAKNVLCVSTSNGIAASFKYFDVPNRNKPGVNMRVHDAKTISEAQVVVDNPTEPGAKRGSLELTFGNRGDHPVKYLVFVPAGGTLTQTKAGSGLAFVFKGQTKDGITLNANAICRDTMKL